MLLEKIFATEQTIDITHDTRLWPVGLQWDSASGETVTPQTAMTLSHYYACLRNISEDIAKLSLSMYERLEPRGRSPRPDHPITRLLSESFNPECSSLSGRETLQQWALSYGNGFAEIVPQPGGAITLWLIHPTRVTIGRDEGGQLVGMVKQDNSESIPIPYDRLFHLRGMGDGTVGYSVVKFGVESIGRALAVQKHSAAVFAGGGTDRLVIRHPESLEETAIKNIRAGWVDNYGGAANTGPAILDEGMDIARIGIPPEDAQMIETLTFTVEDLARWFRCPLSKIQHFLRAQGWSTLEMLNIDYVTDTLLPWAIRWEQEIARKLRTPTERAQNRIYAKHSFASLLRADTKTRAEVYSIMRRLGAYSVNDILELEDRNPIGPEGDVRVIESGLSNLESLTEPAGEGGTADDVGDFDYVSIIYPLAKSAVDKLLRKESNQIAGARRRYSDKGKSDRFESWADKFYADFRAEVDSAVRLVVETAAKLKPSKVNLEEIVGEYADAHIKRSREELCAGEARERLLTIGADHLAELCLRGIE